MCWEDDGSWTPLSNGVCTARKEHRCAEGCRIKPGDAYYYGCGVFEGDFSAWKLCEPCNIAAKALGAACRLYDRYSTDPPIGLLRDAYQEHIEWGELDTSAVPAATVWKLRRYYVALRKRAVA